MPIPGIDVSEHQGNINWPRVFKSGIKFAMIRSSYGDSNEDKMFKVNIKNAQENGILVGCYHYCYATDVKSAKLEANYFLNTIKDCKIEYPIALDIEDPTQKKLSKKLITEIAKTFLTTIALSNYYVMIYSSRSWFSHVLDDDKLMKFDHWIAQWGPDNTYKGSTGIWQYSSEGKVDGINGYVDLDYGYKNFDFIIKKNKLNNL